MVLRALPADVAHCFRNGLIHQLRRQFQLHCTVFNPGDGEQVFHKVNEPKGIVVDRGIELFAFFRPQAFSVCHQNPGVAGNGGQRRAQIVGDGAQEIGAQLLVFCKNSGLLPFPYSAFIFKCECAFPEDGQDNAVFKGVERRLAGQADADHAIYHIAHPHSKVKAFCAAQRICCGSCACCFCAPRRRPLARWAGCNPPL